jgi:cyclopropane-fatty-acyl-phospholipid synthase
MSQTAVGSLEMGEHVGERNYPTYVEVLRRAVRPGGRVLVQQMSRPGPKGGRHPGGGGPFIESFIAPDMHMRPVGETVAYLEHGGLKVRDVHALREHYVRMGVDQILMVRPDEPHTLQWRRRR